MGYQPFPKPPRQPRKELADRILDWCETELAYLDKAATIPDYATVDGIRAKRNYRRPPEPPPLPPLRTVRA